MQSLLLPTNSQNFLFSGRSLATVKNHWKLRKAPKSKRYEPTFCTKLRKGIEPIAFAKNVKNVRPSYNFLFVALLPVVFGEKLSKSNPQTVKGLVRNPRAFELTQAELILQECLTKEVSRRCSNLRQVIREHQISWCPPKFNGIGREIWW